MSLDAAAERRRNQNREAQRKHRRTLRKQVEELKEKNASLLSLNSAMTAHQAVHRATSMINTMQQGAFYGEAVLNQHHAMLSATSSPCNIDDSWFDSMNTDMLTPVSPSTFCFPISPHAQTSFTAGGSLGHEENQLGPCRKSSLSTMIDYQEYPLSDMMRDLDSASTIGQILNVTDSAKCTATTASMNNRINLGSELHSPVLDWSVTSSPTPSSHDEKEVCISVEPKFTTLPQFPEPPHAARSALHQALANSHMSVIHVLVEAGADVNTQDEYGRTPLHECAIRGNAVLSRYLLEKGARCDITDNESLTPLQHAAALGHVAVVKLLVHNGADINARKQIKIGKLE